MGRESARVCAARERLVQPFEGLVSQLSARVWSYVQHAGQSSVYNQTGRNTLSSSAKEGERGPREPCRVQPGVSEYTCSLEMLSLKFGPSHTLPPHHFPFRVLPYSHSTKALGALHLHILFLRRLSAEELMLLNCGVEEDS